MDNTQFINHLQKLSTNRFALDALPSDEFEQLSKMLLANFGVISTNNSHWYLLGTDGCHLCHTAHALLMTAQRQRPFELCKLDLAQAQDVHLVDILGDKIPLLLTPKRLLCYPFGLMDVVFL